MYQLRLAIVPLLVLASTVHAQTADDDALVKKARLSVSAFQCAIVSTHDKQVDRLFLVGLKNGREFVDTMRAKPDVFKRIRDRVPMLMTTNGGPTTDFILGQVYAQLAADIYKKFELDEKLWKLI